MNALCKIVSVVLCLCLAMQGTAVSAIAPEAAVLPGLGPMNNQKILSDLLNEAWRSYKQRFIQADGRVLDRSNQMITTSEGQSYALLRSVWMDDAQTFDTVWKWNVANIKRSDNLFAWKWGRRDDESWGILDTEAASDADEDIAYALILASIKWRKPDYLDAARLLLADIWNKEVVEVHGAPFMTPGPSFAKNDHLQLNPSYFAPYEYRLFARIDPAHNWSGLIDSSYTALNQMSDLSRLQLPPDWCVISRSDGKISLNPHDRKSDYSYDAMRVPWRVAADLKWYGEERALSYLKRLGFLLDSWQLSRTVRGAYSPTGVMMNFDEPLAGFGCLLPMFGILSPPSAGQVMQERLVPHFYSGIWRPEDDYYGNNWAWFGIALYADAIAAPPTHI